MCIYIRRNRTKKKKKTTTTTTTIKTSTQQDTYKVNCKIHTSLSWYYFNCFLPKEKIYRKHSICWKWINGKHEWLTMSKTVAKKNQKSMTTTVETFLTGLISLLYVSIRSSTSFTWSYNSQWAERENNKLRDIVKMKMTKTLYSRY